MLLDIIIVYYVLYVDLTGPIKPVQKEVVPHLRRSRKMPLLNV